MCARYGFEVGWLGYGRTQLGWVESAFRDNRLEIIYWDFEYCM